MSSASRILPGMRTQTLVAALAVVVASCSSNPPSEMTGHEQTAQPPTTIPSVVQETPAAAPALELDKPFSIAATFSGAQASVMGNTIGLSVFHQRAEDGMFFITAFKLNDGRFDKIGSAVLTPMDYPGDLEEHGGHVYLSVVSPVERSANRRLLPIPEAGKPIDLGDVHNAEWALMYKAQTPACGEPAAADGKVAMKRVDQAFDLDSSLLLLGDACDGTRSLQVLDNLARTSRSMQLDRAASVFQTNFGLVLIADDLAMWNGSAFVSVAPRPPAGTTSILKGPGGAFFASTKDTQSFDTSLENHVLRDGTWRLLALPDGRTKFDLRLGDTSLWAFAGDHLTGLQVYKYLLPNEQAPKAGSLVGDEAVAGAPAPAANATAFSTRPGGPKCDTNVVVLYGFTKVTPADYDFPLTRKAIKGHSELSGVSFAVTEERGKKYFVGRTPSFDKAAKLAKVIESGVQGSKPQIVCSEPTVLRELSIDLATGNVKP
jgi:hypothetical protein